MMMVMHREKEGSRDLNTVCGGWVLYHTHKHRKILVTLGMVIVPFALTSVPLPDRRWGYSFELKV